MNPSIVSADVEGSPIRVHAIQTGTISVKDSHRTLQGPAALRFPRILADRHWTEPLPIYTWVVEHPEGILLIDTGENAGATQKEYFDCDPISGRINSWILRLDVAPEEEITPQLAMIGMRPDDVRWVVLTHLHLDHVDGLHAFPRSEVIVAQREWDTRYGAVPCLLPDWLEPRLISFPEQDPIFSGAFPLTRAGDVVLVPTPGHSVGHLSVILKGAASDTFFAGDASFSQEQLLWGELAGISADLDASLDTYRRIQRYAYERPTLYLPSHDPRSATRLNERLTLSEQASRVLSPAATL